MDLAALPAPQPVFGPTFIGCPTELHELPDGAVIVTDHNPYATAAPKATAVLVWPDGSGQLERLGGETADLTAVLPIDGDMVLVSLNGNYVRRVGTIAWTCSGMARPWSAVLMDDGTLAVSESQGHQVRIVDLHDGRTLRTVGGAGVLQRPVGLAVSSIGELYVADAASSLVLVLKLLANFTNFHCLLLFLVFNISRRGVQWPRRACSLHRVRPPQHAARASF